MFLDKITNFIGPGGDLVFVLSFDHNAQQGLSAGVADQYAPLVAQLLLNFMNLAGNLRNGQDVLSLADSRVNQDLRQRNHYLSQLGEWLLLAPHDSQQLQSGKNAVAGGAGVEENHVTGLFAP